MTAEFESRLWRYLRQMRAFNPDGARAEANGGYTDGKRKAGRASALARARRRANPAPGVVDLRAWQRLRELEESFGGA